ncbi:protein translocase subunit SecF [Halopseudomonas sp. Lyrl_26]|uniref:protein translocase subunit SecF n=1 Tax=Halopseudomonas sp. Lyrl_26 TaxID=3110923 RepID=UPI003F7FD421
MLNNTINFMRWRKPFYVIALVFCLASIASLVVKGLNFSLDFTGGAQVELSYSEPVDLAAVRQTLQAAGLGDAIVQNFGSTSDVMIRLASDDPNVGSRIAQLIRADNAAQEVTVKRVEFIGPQVGEELRDQGGIGLLLALGGILLYVAMRFQFKFSTAAVVALLHDAIFTLGILSFFNIPFDLTVLAALLAGVGYSLNDTIVVFDRVRENMRLMRNADLAEVINVSTTQTLARTLATSASTIVVLLSLLLVGGESLYGFALTLIVGVVIGTYSSIYVANGLLISQNLTREDLIPKQLEEVDDRP